MKKKLPINIDDFKEIIERNYYYVDKTDFIHEILEGMKKRIRDLYKEHIYQ